MKKLLALLLVLGMLFSMLPTISAAKKYDSEDIWEIIEAIENQKIHVKRGQKVSPDAYAAIIDDIVAAVEASSVYSEGTLIRNGDFLFWETTDGEVCGYSPRLRADIVNSHLDELDLEANSGVETVSYAAKRNSPSAAKVTLIEPFYGTDKSFTKQYQTEANSIAKATGGTYTLYKTSSATIDVIADALESSAVVIFDSHGDTDYDSGREDYTSKANTSYLLLASGTGLTSADKSKATGEFGTYYHAFSSSGYYYVDGTAIANHMEKSAPNNLLWMAICLGMATDGINAPLRNKGVGVVYGYSQSVTFDGDYFWEETFWDSMKNGATVSSAISTMKSTGGAWDYSKELYNHNGWKTDSDMCPTITKARNNYAAFPIVVSAEDAYPGHGKVDNLQTVKSTWTLKALDHDYAASVTAPTCTEKGYTTHICSRCGDTYRDSYVDALGHDYAASVTAPTCTEKGFTTHICSRCGDTCRDSYVDALGHSFENGICTVCGAKDPDYKPDSKPCDGGADCPCNDYSDLSSSKWYHNGVDYALNNGLMNGVGSGRFEPDSSLTRAMLVTILYRSEGEPDVAGESNPFTDVPNGQWYTDAIVWAAGKGIVNGTSATTFAPNASITREQIAAILYRYAGAPAVSGNLFKFTDAFSVSEYAQDAMVWAVNEGIIGGSDGMLSPKDNATRAQIATILYRYLAQ